MRRINQHWVNEIHANARFDIIKNKGFWLNGEQEIEDDDWHNPKQESFIYNPHQPNNPNYLAVVTGCSGCIMSGADEKIFIRKSVKKVDLLPQYIKVGYNNNYDYYGVVAITKVSKTLQKWVRKISRKWIKERSLR